MKNFTLLISTLFIFFQSCSKQEGGNEIDENIPEGYALLKVDIPEIAVQEENLDGSKLASAKVAEKQPVVVSAGGFKVDAVLEPVGVANGLKNAAEKLNKQADTKIFNVAKDVKYRIYVFDKITGNIVDSALYSRGSEATAAPIKIVGGKKYTIIAYSNNSVDAPAYLENKQNISTAEITNKNVDFMFNQQDLDVAPRTNHTIKIKFRHTFSQITTTIKLDATTAAYSYIRNISSATFIKPSYEETKFKVSDQTIKGIKESALGAPVIFPFINLSNTSIKTTTTTNPTVINSPETGKDGTMIIEALTIGNVTRGNIVVNNLKLTPGVKYNLILTFKVPETVELAENPYFSYYDDVNTGGTTYFEKEVELVNPTYGAQLDIFYLDNSFQLYVNDKPVFSKEINFEDVLGSDVQFSDGTWYGSNGSGTSVIYNINRNIPRQEIPIIRLVIDEFGNIQLFGRKNVNQTLRALTFRNGVTYTPVQFIPHGKNILRFRSSNWTITDVWGRIYGIRIK